MTTHLSRDADTIGESGGLSGGDVEEVLRELLAGLRSDGRSGQAASADGLGRGTGESLQENTKGRQKG
jgi:hypothetical protein